MIDAARTRAQLLAEIGAPVSTCALLSDPADARLLTANAHALVRAPARDDLFAVLEVMLSKRFAGVRRDELIRDLLVPLRHALGNAQKHGNRNDPGKSIAVEIVASSAGCLIAVTDEGAGFDVPATLGRFRDKEQYYTNAGSGFRNLDRAAAPVSFENGGRTLLLCFRPLSARDEPVVPDAGPPPPPEGALVRVCDPEWAQPRLCALPLGLAGRIVSCGVFLSGSARTDQAHAGQTAGVRGHEHVVRYVLRLADARAQPGEMRIVTGRLHADAQRATAEFDAATRLYDQLGEDEPGSKHFRLPRPMGFLADEPRLVLHDFNPWMSLRERLADLGEPDAVRRYARRAGAALATLHTSRTSFVEIDTHRGADSAGAIVGRGRACLEAMQAPLADRFQTLAASLAEEIERISGDALAPAHGAMDLDAIHYGVDGRWYLQRLEACRMSRPGADLASFLADLLAFTAARCDLEGFRSASKAFLKSYERARDEPPHLVRGGFR